jgi:hypothetical protein
MASPLSSIAALFKRVIGRGASAPAPEPDPAKPETEPVAETPAETVS